MCGVTKLYKIRNERLRVTTKVGKIANKVEERRFKWRAWVCDEKKGCLSGVHGYVMRRKEV